MSNLNGEYKTGDAVQGLELRTIYLNGKLVGVMDTPELAREVVDALNGGGPWKEVCKLLEKERNELNRRLAELES